jgi:Protein of unknown function (DUF3592)
MKTRSLLFALLIAYIWLLAVAYESGEAALLAWLSTDWQKTTATVVESTSEGSCWRRTGAVHKLIYSYTVGTESYTGSRKSFASAPCQSQTDSKRVAAEFPVGSKLQVWVHPEQPRYSVVFPGQLSVGDYWQLVALGLSIALLPWGAWRFASRAA